MKKIKPTVVKNSSGPQYHLIKTHPF